MTDTDTTREPRQSTRGGCHGKPTEWRTLLSGARWRCDQWGDIEIDGESIGYGGLFIAPPELTAMLTALEHQEARS